MSVVIHDEPLLHRHDANPILTSKDWPYPINSVFQRWRNPARGWIDAVALPRGGPKGPLASLCGALGKWSGRMADRSDANAHGRSGKVS